MKKIVSIAVLMLTAMVVNAQKVTFYSQEFENGVRYHIGLGESDNVLQTHTDTITTLNLSGLGITDIRDAVYLTAVTKLDLSYNSITDVSPLLTLSSLRELNLSNNKLEDINILAFVEAESMEVDVSNNYISDFSYFYTPGLCDFTFMGMGLQMEKDTPYFDIYQLYATVDSANRSMISYRGYTNMPATTNIKCGSFTETAEIDGDGHVAVLPTTPTETTEVTLTNGLKSIKTYAVPAKFYKVEAGKTVSMETGLPEQYTISAYASKGTVEIVDNNTLKYTAPQETVSDIVYFCYNEGTTLKGISRSYVNKGDIDGDGDVDKADLEKVVNYIMNPSEDFNKDAADMNGDNKVNAADVVLIVNIMTK